MKRKLLLEIFIITAFFPIIIFAQTVRSNCWVTKIGNPGDQKPVLPPGCESPGGVIDGVETPPNLECRSDGYCKMPEATDGSYQLYSCENQRWGSKELVSVLYTVAKNWKARHSEGFLYIGDLTAAGHKSHFWGRAVDVYGMTNPNECVANYDDGDDNPACGSSNYNREETIELGKMFANTNHVLHIWYNDQAVNNAVLDHASKGHSPNMVMQYEAGHANHFHLDVTQEPPKLPDYGPGC
jgi:hypothetical protein